MKPADLSFWGVALHLLNLLDYFATIFFVVGLGAKELNPMVAFLLETDPALFAGFKAFVVPLGVFILTYGPSHTHTARKRFLTTITGIYGLAGAYHCAHLLHYIVTVGLS